MFYAYIFLGAGILILSILFRLAAVFRLTIPLLYALVVPTLLSDWYYAHYTLANVIWYRSRRSIWAYAANTSSVTATSLPSTVMMLAMTVPFSSLIFL